MFTLPPKLAFTGPTWARTLAVNSVSDSFSTRLTARDAALQDLRIVEPLPDALAGSGDAKLARHFHRQIPFLQSASVRPAHGDCNRVGRMAAAAE